MYTIAMGIGVVLGVVVGGVVSPLWQERFLGVFIDAPIWSMPITLLNRLSGGMGGDDVRLAPVLGVSVGPAGLHATFLVLALSFVSAGVAALWKIVVGSADTKTRAPTDPWMIGATFTGTIAWGVVPDWL